jgi:UDP-galactose transporter
MLTPSVSVSVFQLKILFTAVFSRLLLHKKLHWYQWRALTLLSIGVILVQLPASRPAPALCATDTTDTAADTTHGHRRLLEIVEVAPAGTDAGVSASTGGGGGGGVVAVAPPASLVEIIHAAVSSPPRVVSDPPLTAAESSVLLNSGDRLAGVLATLATAVLSGFGGSFMERMLKATDYTVWDRNFQLALVGLAFGSLQLALFASHADRVFAAAHGWFGGFTSLTLLIVCLSSLGGILVSLVLLTLDSITRGFATSASIVLTALLSAALFHDIELTPTFACGAVTVLLAVANYQDTMLNNTPNTAAPETESGSTDERGALALGVEVLGTPIDSTECDPLLLTRSPANEDIEMAKQMLPSKTSLNQQQVFDTNTAGRVAAK